MVTSTTAEEDALGSVSSSCEMLLGFSSGIWHLWFTLRGLQAWCYLAHRYQEQGPSNSSQGSRGRFRLTNMPWQVVLLSESGLSYSCLTRASSGVEKEWRKKKRHLEIKPLADRTQDTTSRAKSRYNICLFYWTGFIITQKKILIWKVRISSISISKISNGWASKACNLTNIQN